MLPANLINALQVFFRSDQPLIAAATNSSISKIEPGQQLQGSVQSQLGLVMFKVLVEGQTFQMRLPGNVSRPGSNPDSGAMPW
jgi:hypothetical protein